MQGAVQVSRENLRIPKIRTVGTIVLNILKTIAAIGDFPRLRKWAYDCLYYKPLQLLKLYTIVAQNCDSVIGV